VTTAPQASSSPQVIERSPSNTRPRPRVSAEQSELFSRYPLFFRAVAAADAHPSNIGNFGIQCGPGWYQLIEEAAKRIEHELRQIWSSQVANWQNIAAIEHALLMEQADSVYPVLPVCTDIQQVNGALVIVVVPGFVCDYDSAQWPRLVDIVQKIREESNSVCESCGNAGKMRKTYWHHVYCDSCIAPIGDIEQPDL
jgi:putative intracellular protease/amidase